ncbi:MAG: SDR family oxidoreductase, partial [Acidimicrobiia bacterium]
GRGLVLALAGAGCHLLLHYNRSSQEAEATAAEARALGVRVELQSADLSEPSESEAVINAAVASLGPAQVLLNSAAIFPGDTLEDVSVEAWNETLRINLTGPVFLTQAFARALPEGLDAAVVNITDWRTARPYPGHFSYTVAKGGLDAFTRAAAVALAPRIRVNAVALGAILPPAGRDSAYLKELARELPLRRIGSVDLIAEAVLHVLRNDFMTGEIMRVDGGAHLV